MDEIEEDWSHCCIQGSPAKIEYLEGWFAEYTRYTVKPSTLYPKRSLFDWVWTLLGYKINYMIFVEGGTAEEWKEIRKLFKI